MIDWNVRISDIAVIVSLLGTGVLFAFKAGAFTASIDAMQKQIEALQNTSKTIAAALTTLAVQKVQIERIEKDLGDLKRGDGWIKPSTRGGINGEYE